MKQYERLATDFSSTFKIPASEHAAYLGFLAGFKHAREMAIAFAKTENVVPVIGVVDLHLLGEQEETQRGTV